MANAGTAHKQSPNNSKSAGSAPKMNAGSVKKHWITTIRSAVYGQIGTDKPINTDRLCPIGVTPLQEDNDLVKVLF